MNYKFIVLLAFNLLLSSPCFSEYYKEHTEISDIERMFLNQHTLPENHPLNPLLKSLFATPGLIENDDTLLEAGFSLLHIQETSFVRIALHPAFPDVIFKIYTNEESRKKEDKPGWYWLLCRCIGAENIRNYIKDYKIKHFVVPDKWLFPIPPDPTRDILEQQPVILIATKMDILPYHENQQAWFNASKEQVDELYDILREGYGSPFLPGNIPAIKNGKFAFVDTERPQRQIKMKGVLQFLSPKMQKYWRKKMGKN